MRLREASTGCSNPSNGPQSVSVVLTNACNLACISCWSYSPLRTEGPSIEWMRKRLTRNLLAPVFDQLRALNTERVIFTGGGEPLAHPESLDIIGDAKAAGLRVTLISNLTLARDPERLYELGVDTVMANFSCGDPQSYVAFHPGRTEADYGRVVHIIDELVRSGSEVKLVFVVCSVNVRSIPAVLDLAAQWDARIQFKLISTTPQTEVLSLSDEDRTWLLTNRERFDAHPARTNLDVLWKELSGSTRNRFPIDDVGCFAGTHYARIEANGEVRYCCNQQPELAMGSVYEQSFADLWASEKWTAMRQQLAEGTYLPGCDQCGKFDLNMRVRAAIGRLQPAG
jgi:radical SAM protein with 4Fe4S-binding SPASM domain